MDGMVNHMRKIGLEDYVTKYCADWINGRLLTRTRKN